MHSSGLARIVGRTERRRSTTLPARRSIVIEQGRFRSADALASRFVFEQAFGSVIQWVRVLLSAGDWIRVRIRFEGTGSHICLSYLIRPGGASWCFRAFSPYTIAGRAMAPLMKMRVLPNPSHTKSQAGVGPGPIASQAYSHVPIVPITPITKITLRVCQ